MSVVLKNTVLVTINGVKDNKELNTPKGRVDSFIVGIVSLYKS